MNFSKHKHYLMKGKLLPILTVIMISLLTWNVRGVMSSAACLSNLLEYSACDIAMICEHKLFNHSIKFLDSIDSEFSCYANCDTTINVRTSRCGKGGVAILYRKKLEFQVSPIEINNSERIIGMEVKYNQGQSLYIFSVYLPASSNMDEYRYEMNILKDYVTLYSGYGKVVVGGDFNASIVESDLHRTNTSKSVEFSNLIINNALVPVNASNQCVGSRYTYIPCQTLLDYILVDDSLYPNVRHCENLEEGTLGLTSDHLPVMLSIDIPIANDTLTLPAEPWPSWHKATISDLSRFSETSDSVINTQNYKWR